MSKLNNLVFLFILFMLSGCSLLSPVKTETKEYQLNAVAGIPVKKNPLDLTLLVTEPEAMGINNSKDMAYSIKPYEIDYFAKSGWAETPTKMLQPLMMKALQNTHYFYAVVTPQTLGRYDLVLNTQLTEFQQVFFVNHSVFRMTLNAQLVNVTTAKVLASKQFAVEAIAPQYSPYGGVLAANRATARVLEQLTRWCITRT